MVNLAPALDPILQRVRTDVTAVKTASGNVFRSRDPISPERIARHLNGGPARGVYCIKPGESTTRTALLDLDSHKGETSWDDMTEVARAITKALKAQGLKVNPWRSGGGKGIHLFMLWDEPQDAYSVRMLLNATINSLGYTNGSGGVGAKQIEIFPKQDQVALGGFGNQFFLPLAGQSVPLEPFLGLAPLERADALTVPWEISPPVPVLPKPERKSIPQARAGSGNPDLERYRMALTYVKPDPEGGDYSYDIWVTKVGMPLHFESQGSDDGFDIWNEWSARGASYPGEDVLRYKWSTFIHNKEQLTTGATILSLARDAGWVEDVSGDFEDIAGGGDGEDGAAPLKPAVPIITDDKNHLAIAGRIIAERYMWDAPGLKRFGGDWYEYKDTHYIMRGDETIENAVRRYLSSAGRQIVSVKKKKDKETGEVTKTKTATVQPFNPTAAEISAIFRALKTAAEVNADLVPPCWADCEPESGAGGNARDHIAMQDGILHLPTRTLQGHTATFFTLNSLPYKWEGGEGEPVQWQAFLRSIWPDDKQSADTLQEIFGYLLTSDTSLQKMFLIQGDPRTGKGTIGRVLQALVGDENTVGTSFKQLGNRFGLEGLIGKTVAILPESRNTGNKHGDIQDAVERLLSISGEDKISVERKHIGGTWNGKLNTRFVMLANQVPGLGDSSGAFVSRFIALRTPISFLGREDEGLSDKLLAELPQILRWSLAGLDRLKARGRFVQPESGRKVLEELGDANNHVRVFVRDCCELGVVVKEGPQGEYSGPVSAVLDVYNAYRVWCAENGRDRPESMFIFAKSLLSECKQVTVGQPKKFGGRRAYIGLRLRAGGSGFDLV